MGSATIFGDQMNPFQVGQPTPPGFIMGMGNIITGGRTFSANLTYLSH